jgi:hypothetical protein
MELINEIRIELQRRIFRIKRKWRIASLEKKKRAAITEANRLKGITGKQHKVLLLDGDYIVRSRKDIIRINKMFQRQAKYNLIDIDKITIYTTK